MRDICLVSGGDHRRQSLRSPVNHKIFCTLRGYDYRYEVGPYRNLRSPYYFKLQALRESLSSYDWVAWLDDDAFVTNFDSSFQELIDEAEEAGQTLVVADSPVNAQGDWTRLNSGVILAKNDPRTRSLLDEALSQDIADLANQWDTERFGRFTRGDQDALIWAIDTSPNSNCVSIVAHERMNARRYEYRDSADEHFICHFVGVPHKRAAIGAFARQFGLDESLVPRELLREFSVPTEPVMPPLRAQLAETRAKIGSSSLAAKVINRRR